MLAKRWNVILLTHNTWMIRKCLPVKPRAFHLLCKQDYFSALLSRLIKSFFFPVSAVSKLLTFDTVCTSKLLSFYCGQWMWSVSWTEQLIPVSFNFVLLCKVFLTIVFLVESLDCEFVKLFSLAVRSLMLYTFGSSALLSTNKVESSLRYVLFVYCLLV